ncbi:MAG: dihydrofolate reductase family protein [Anaerolineales bacterium]|nr:dihydrofolate reductase family protein [Anaerolineales bacterium]
MNRPFVFINVAMTADGKIDTFERKGAAISSLKDKERVDKLRAESDAILVGGRTLLDEDPKLIVKSESLRAERLARGLSANPIKVGVATKADVKLDSNFLIIGRARIVIFTTHQTSMKQLNLLRAHPAEVFVHETPRVDLISALETLKKLGVNRLMVEGGGTMNFELIKLGLVDELTAYVAPMVFGGANAPTMADSLGVARAAALHLTLMDVEKWDDGGVLLRYKL